MAERSYRSEDCEYVDIHGRDIRVVISDETREILVPLQELKQTGFNIYRKSQFNKLLVDDRQFNKEFNLHMLDSARKYMLDNLVKFNENDILESINKCKKILVDGESATPQSDFLKNRSIEDNPDTGIQITREVRQSISRSPISKDVAPLTTQNLNTHTNSNVGKFGTRGTSGGNDSSYLNQGSAYDKQTEQNSDQQSERSFSGRPPMKKTFDSQQKRDGNFGQQNYQQGKRDSNFNPHRRNGFQNSYKDDNPTRPSNSNNSLRMPNTDGDYGKQKFGNNMRAPRDDNTNGVVREPPPTILLEPGKEHEVMVSFIEKRNAVWVQDKRNISVLADIFSRVNEEESKQEVTNITKELWHKMCMAQDEQLWFRCKVINLNPPKVLFVDYGNTVEVNEVKLISESLAEIPYQAVRVTFYENEYEPRDEDEIRIRPIKRYDTGTYVINVVKDSKTPQEKTKNAVASSNATAETLPEVKKPENPGCFEIPEPLTTISHGQIVIIIKEENGKFYLRTRECDKKLKQIENNIVNVNNYHIQNVKTGQLVLCNKDGESGLFRARISNISGTLAQVDYLDFYEKGSVAVNSLYNISEALCAEPLTYFASPVLRDIGEKKLGDKAKDFIKECINKRTKFSVIIDGGQFDLKLGEDGLLSKTLSALERPSDRIMIDQMKVTTPEFGVEQPYMYYTFENLDNITIVPYNEEFLSYLGRIIKTDLPDTTPYLPIKNEVCFGSYEGSWYRCVVQECVNERYTTFFIDFGNKETLDADNLRKLTKDVKDIPVLGLPCKFVGISKNSVNEKDLKEHIVEGEVYYTIVKNCVDKTFLIECPKVYELLNEK